jgi:hypothetical protein
MIPNQIVIDLEFQNLIRPLSDKERKELKESLSRCGLLSPLVIWRHEDKSILVDGHNRLSLWKEFDGFDGDFEFKTQELRFGNRDKVKEWIIKNQLGRRNLSPKDFKILAGQLYNQRKKSKESNLKQNAPKDQNDPSDDTAAKDQNDTLKKDTTAEVVAAETGLSPATIKRAGKLAAKVEELQVAEPETPREDIIAKAEEIIAAKPKANPEPPKRSLDELLAQRWKKFIKDIPVTDHTAVRLWVTAKLKEAAL